MARFLAQIISVIFQPLVIPALGFALILFGVPEASSIPQEFKSRIFYLVSLSTLAIPMITVIGLRVSGTVKSLHMIDLKDRLIPFSVISIYYLMTVYFMYQMTELDPILWQSLAIMTAVVVVLTIVTFFWKMSAHMTGVGGLLALVVVLGMYFPNFSALYPLLGALMLCGIVGSSRLLLDAHKPVEVYVGFAYGFISCLIGFLWIWR